MITFYANFNKEIPGTSILSKQWRIGKVRGMLMESDILVNIEKKF